MGRQKYSNPHNIKIGDKFGEWTVTSDVILTGAPRYRSLRECKCSCGTVKNVDEFILVKGLSKSCGCLNRRFPDIEIGKKYGTLTVLEESEQKMFHGMKSERQWLCKCDCGNVVVKGDQDLKKAKNPTCKMPDHDIRRMNPLAVKLKNMANAIRVRCRVTTNSNFVGWGGRGIKCELGDNQLDIAVSLTKIPGYFEGATIDRIDNDGNYTLWHNEHGYKAWVYHDPVLDKDFKAMGNLRWVTNEENNAHKYEREWNKDDFSKRLLSVKGFMHHLGDNFRYSDFKVCKTNAIGRNNMTCHLFIHKENIDKVDTYVEKFKKIWEDNNGEISIDDNPIDVTNEFLGVKTYGKANLSFRDGKRMKYLTSNED